MHSAFKHLNVGKFLKKKKKDLNKKLKKDYELDSEW